MSQSFVYGDNYDAYDKDMRPIGTVAGDEYVKSPSNQFLYRIDGEEIYTPGLKTKLLGFMDGLTARSLGQGVLFILKRTKSRPHF